MKILFAGTPSFGLPALLALMETKYTIAGIFTQPDRPSGRGRQLQKSPVKQFAEAHHLPLFQPVSLKTAEQHDLIRALAPDVIIVAAYGLILPKTILDIPSHGCINIHASLLPKYRGAAPIQRAILSGEKETGITIMQMDAGLDTGDMLYRLSCPIEPLDNTQTLHDKLSQLGAKGLLHVMEHLKSIVPEKQNDALATYAAKISKSETLLDFNKTAIECERAVRAYYPAQIYYKDQYIKIWEAKAIALESLGIDSMLGKVSKANASGIEFIAAKGILRCTQLQMPGGKRLSAREILNARNNIFTL